MFSPPFAAAKAGLAAAGIADYKDIFFLAYFGCFGRLFMVSRSVCVKGILFSNTGSMYGFMSSAVPHEAFCQVLF